MNYIYQTELRYYRRDKNIFVAFAIEDENQRNLLKSQSLLTTSPFEYIDMSVKEAYDENWKERVRIRIRRTDGVIVLASNSSLKSSGQKWEIIVRKKKIKNSWNMDLYRRSHGVL